MHRPTIKPPTFDVLGLLYLKRVCKISLKIQLHMKGLKDEFSKESAVLFVNKWLISKKDYNKGNIKAPLSELKCSEFKFACTSTHPSKTLLTI